MTVETTLQQAQELILAHAVKTAVETVSLGDSLHRIPSISLRNRSPKPAFSQSTRDGYALAPNSMCDGPHEDYIPYTIIGEVAAGDTNSCSLKAGQAVRITTGSMIPENTERVVPFEICQEQQERVLVPASTCGSSECYIRKRGSDLPSGRILAVSGQPIVVDHLPLLAGDGFTAAEVHKKPIVTVLCTGSELIDSGSKPDHGQKISGNIFFLDGLIHQAGGRCKKLGTVSDNTEEICEILARQAERKPQVIITTGGMGPGKYDLMEKVFRQLGGRVLYNRLQVRPGKATLCGILNQTLFFALPGPPPAVRLLFQELVEPALFKMQGAQSTLPRNVRAELLEPLVMRHTGALVLKGGVLDERKGRLTVRPAQKTEPLNSIIILPAHRRTMKKHELVHVHCPRFSPLM